MNVFAWILEPRDEDGNTMLPFNTWAHQDPVMAAMAHFPGTVEMVLRDYDAVEKEGKRLGDVLTGYLDTNEEERHRFSIEVESDRDRPHIRDLHIGNCHYHQCR